MLRFRKIIGGGAVSIPSKTSEGRVECVPLSDAEVGAVPWTLMGAKQGSRSPTPRSPTKVLGFGVGITVGGASISTMTSKVGEMIPSDLAVSSEHGWVPGGISMGPSTQGTDR